MLIYKNFKFIFPILFFFILVSISGAEEKEVVLINKTKPGKGATEEQAGLVYDAFLKVMKTLEGVDVRTDSSCEEPCEKPNIIISSELRIEEPYITVLFRIINRKKGLAANIQRIRMKDAKLEDVIRQLNQENVLPLFDFIDRGAYSKSQVIEKK